MRPTPIAGLALCVVAAAGCGERPEPLGVAPSLHVQTASAPIRVPFFNQFQDVNPCSGLPMTVTMIGTELIHEHNGRVVVTGQRTITTSDGFEGRGTHTFVVNGNVARFTLNDMLRHPSGDRFRAHSVLIVDISTTPPTVRVEDFLLTCVGP